MTVASDLEALVPAVALLEQGLTLANEQKQQQAVLIAGLEADKAALAARVRELEAGTPPAEPPPPPVRRVMPIGAVEGDDLAKLINEPFGMSRRYSKTPVSTSQIDAWVKADIGKSLVVYSQKGAPWSSSQMARFPRNGQIRVLIYENEPERANKNTNRQAYVSAATTNVANVNAAGRDDLFPGAGHMGWHELDNDPATSTALWFPTGDLSRVYLELHPYDRGKTTLRSLYKPTLDLWRARDGGLWGLGEVGSLGRGDTQEAAWIDQGIAAAYEDGCGYFAFFDSDIGGTGDWSNTTPAVIASIAKAAPEYAG